MCNRFDAEQMEKNLFKGEPTQCHFCEDFPDCNKIFYHYSHSKIKIDKAEWCREFETCLTSKLI